jgi:flavodoxin
MIIYFSGTGNSKYCADMFAKKLGDEVIDAFGYIKNGIAGEFISGTPWIFASPTYAWQIPHMFEDFIRAANFDGNKDAYFVMTCGSDIGAASEKLAELCKEGDFETSERMLHMLMYDKGIAPNELLNQLYRAVSTADDIDRRVKTDLIDAIGETDFRLSEGANADIQMDALIAKFIKIWMD